MATVLAYICWCILLLAYATTTLSSTTSLSPTSVRSCTHKPAALKRWYGVPDCDDSTDRDQDEKAFAWPQKCGPPNLVQPVRYCFKDERSARNLEPILHHAIARWAPAMQDHVSALSIDLDEGTGNDPHVYCSDPKVSDDALVISDETRDGDNDWNWNKCDTESTTGYYYYDSDERGRHTLDFCSLYPDDPEGTKPWAIRAMMHELGHVMGLQHEHQRPDQGDHLYYMPENLNGYKEAVKRADIDEWCKFHDGTSMEKKIEAICNDASFARFYLPEAMSFIKGDDMYPPAKWSSYVQSTKFDFESIMIYNSDSNTIARNKMVIWKKSGGDVWMGGDPDPGKARISAGDIARVAQLYPSGKEEGKQKQDLGVWGVHQAVRIRIRDVFETVIFAPNATVDI